LQQVLQVQQQMHRWLQEQRELQVLQVRWRQR
jgi:hypothetical protein